MTLNGIQVSNSRAVVKEGQNINLSLHFLEQVIITLRDHNYLKTKGGVNAKENWHVPYRNSVLTNILRDSLGGNCKSYFLLTLPPEVEHFEETISTCRYKINNDYSLCFMLRCLLLLALVKDAARSGLKYMPTRR